MVVQNGTKGVLQTSADAQAHEAFTTSTFHGKGVPLCAFIFDPLCLSVGIKRALFIPTV